MFHVANDTLRAMELAALATEQANFKDWWWKSKYPVDKMCLLMCTAALGMCYHRLGMLRDAEKQLLSAMKDQPMIITAVLLAKASGIASNISATF